MQKPNFFISGAPKSGTTALAYYLSEHPGAFVSNPKEPFYWCEDLPGHRRYTLVETREAYLNLFAGASPQQRAIGEGSTHILRSKTAVPDILRFNPDAKFIVMLRNPVELVHAFHGQLLITFNDDEPDFEKAWRMQPERSTGQRLPAACLDPVLLQYERVAQLGTQVERFLSHVPAAQREIILFDDFKQDPAATYRRVLRFLNLEDDGRTEFPRKQQARQCRYQAIHRFVQRPPALLASPVVKLRRYLNTKKSGLVPWIKQRFWRTQQRPPLREAFVDELRSVFRPEVELLGDLLERDLSHWLGRSRETALRQSA